VLNAQQGLVNAMDEAILSGVYRGLDTCVETACSAQRAAHDSSDRPAHIAKWINMSGAPSKILRSLAGRNPERGIPVDPPGQKVDGRRSNPICVQPAIARRTRATSIRRHGRSASSRPDGAIACS
jgi:hypothetical protein